MDGSLQVDIDEVAELTRCPDCAFDNPKGAGFCGMCGNRLESKKLAKKKSSDPTYEKAVLNGLLQEAYNYGYNIWSRLLWSFIGLTVLTAIFLTVFIIIILLFSSIPFLPQALCVLGLSFLWCSSSRIYLDVIREKPISLARAIETGFMRMVPALWILVWLGIGIAFLAGFWWVWTYPEMLFIKFESPLKTVALEGFFLFWRVVLCTVIFVPVGIWLTIFTSLGVLRIVDRKGEVLQAPFWAMKQLWRRLWRFLGIGFSQLVVQLLGTVTCYVGVLASIPLSGISITAVYEWVRLHGEDADEF